MNPKFLAAGLAREIIELDISSIAPTNGTLDLSDEESELTPAIPAQTTMFVFVQLLNERRIEFDVLDNRVPNRDVGTTRVVSLRTPTMGVAIPNMYLTTTNINGNRTNTENPHVLVRKVFRWSMTCLFSLIDNQTIDRG